MGLFSLEGKDVRDGIHTIMKRFLVKAYRLETKNFVIRSPALSTSRLFRMGSEDADRADKA